MTDIEPENLDFIRAWAQTTLRSCNGMNEEQLRDALIKSLTRLAVLLNEAKDDGETDHCPCCGGSGKAEDVSFW